MMIDDWFFGFAPTAAAEDFCTIIFFSGAGYSRTFTTRTRKAVRIQAQAGNITT
jgi:hypothetical protein